MKTAYESIANRIKVASNELQNYSFTEFQKMLPSFIKRDHGYSLLNHVFIQHVGIPIKEYFYTTKRKKANELIHYYHLNAQEVAFQLGYNRPGLIGVKQS